MKVVYLDIDGVLNCHSTKVSVGGYCGIEREKVLLLKQILDSTNAKVVLISSWKEGWIKDNKKKPFQSFFARYLDEEFKKVGIAIHDKTAGGVYARSEGILEYNERFTVKKFVILDDTYADYDGYDLTPVLVKTNAEKGLGVPEMEQAIKLLDK